MLRYKTGKVIFKIAYQNAYQYKKQEIYSINPSEPYYKLIL